MHLSTDVPLFVCLLNSDEASNSLFVAAAALKRVEDIHLVLVAPGRHEVITSTLRRAMRNGLDRIHVLGLPDGVDLIGFIEDADAGLIPEGANGHQALAVFTQAGLPAVIADSSLGADTIKESKAGVVYPVGKPSELAKALRATTRRKSDFVVRIDDDARSMTSWVRDEEIVPSSGLLACARVGIGPANYASQANEWARALREYGRVDAESFSLPGNSRRLPDRVLATSGRPRFRSSVDEMEIVLTRYSHLLVDAFMDVFAGIVADDIGPEIEILRRNGTQLGLIAHGSEVRLPQRHMDRIAHSYFRDAPADFVDARTIQCSRNAATAAAFDGPIFVSTPDMVLDLPTATWLPLVIPEPQTWEMAPAFMHSGPLRVLHRPSRSDPPIKGSAFIMPVLEKLHAEGLIEMVQAPDLVAPEAMPDLMRNTDVLIDQIQSGTYGVASVEAMWAGRLVVGWMAADVRALCPAEVPVIDAAPQDFETVMRELARDRDALPAMAEAGRSYAHEFHDGRRAVEVLRAFVESPVRI